jgi:hypothetical protein
MEKVYKLTTAEGKTRVGYCNETQWGSGFAHVASGGGELCSSNWLHAYTHPLLAVLMNPAHAALDARTMRLWECEAEVGLRKADKIGCTWLKTIKCIPLPQVTTLQQQAFAILAAKAVYKDMKFQRWADNWLNGSDRTAAAAGAAAWAAAWAAARAADAAAEAARAAAEAAAWAADAAAEAARAAAEAARAAYIDLNALAEQAVREF